MSTAANSTGFVVFNDHAGPRNFFNGRGATRNQAEAQVFATEAEARNVAKITWGRQGQVHAV
jgi:hypothetical protein